MFSLYFDYLFFLVISRFGFEDGTLVPIAPGPGNYILVTCFKEKCSTISATVNLR